MIEPMKHVVVLVPGIMGSVLKLGERIIWPGAIRELMFPYRKMEELLSENLEAVDCIRSFVLPQYEDLIKRMRNWTKQGFREEDHTLVVAAYDWRKSNAESAETLAAKLKEVVDRENGNVRISLVAHSMGGLVSRYYLESGVYNGAREWKVVSDLITIATPHRGAAVALPVVAGREKRLFLSAIQVKKLCDDPRYPGAYELLPRKGEPVVWDGTGMSPGINTVDIYDPKIASRLEISAVNLAKASDFHARLDAGMRPEHVNYFCFSGTQEETAAYVRLRLGVNGLIPDKADLRGGGDGTVPNWSSTLSNARFLYVPGEHGTIYQGDFLQKHLAMLLGEEGILAAGAPNELFIDPPVAGEGAELRIRLVFPIDVTELEGQLLIQKMDIDESGREDIARRMTLKPETRILYKGPEIESFLLKMKAPQERGHYRIVYIDGANGEASAARELIVQGG